MVTARILHVWSHLHCKWIAWRGTYAAWKLLPHAIVVGCAVTLVTIHLVHTPPVNVPNTPEVPPYVYLIGIPQGSSDTHTPDWVWMDYPPDIGVPGKHRCHRHCKARYTVPEPATWALMLAGLAGIGFARRRCRG